VESSNPTSRGSIETIGIAGSGAMGRGIAQIAALSGLTVHLYGTSPAASTPRATS